MPHLSAEDKELFKEHGYLVRQDVLSRDQIEAAQDALWEGIEADRTDQATWIGAGPRVPVRSNHPAIRATLHESPAFAMAEELVGKDRLNQGGPGPHLNFPTGSDDWTLPTGGHLDGYYTPTNGVAEGTVGCFQVGVTIYVEDIEPQGGGFTLWPGSHQKAAEYFKTHSLLSLQGGGSRGAFDPGQGREITGPAGTVCFWHGQMTHSGSKNCGRNIRMALIARLARKDVDDIRFESPDDMWEYWEGIG
ncbi:MAG: hypothetical protein GKR89_21795 [Candidatus Latescibacteria bacterium]|nr:hypothetical protein [Candidatus Latescibacterota bacterium]